MGGAMQIATTQDLGDAPCRTPDFVRARGPVSPLFFAAGARSTGPPLGLLLLAAMFAACALCACSAARGDAVRSTAPATGAQPLGGPRTAPDPREVEQRARVEGLWSARSSRTSLPDRCLGPGDLVQVSVYHLPEIQGVEVRVLPSGTVDVPLVGHVRASGLTENQLETALAARLRASIMKRPDVTVRLVEGSSQQVSVTGAVDRPGLIGLSRSHRTIRDMLAEAGGLSTEAGGLILFYPAEGSGACSPSTLRAGPPAATSTAPIALDLNEEWIPPWQNPLHLPAIAGDAIVVNRGAFFVDGWVQHPGAFPLAPGSTVFGAISSAGGALYPADLADVVVWRAESNGSRSRHQVDLDLVASGEIDDITLRAGDIVHVPASGLRMVPYTGLWLITNVIQVGASFPVF